MELLIRQTPTPQGKSLTDRPVFHIIVQGTYNRTGGFHRIRLKQAREDPLSQTPYVLLDGLPVNVRPHVAPVVPTVPVAERASDRPQGARGLQVEPGQAGPVCPARSFHRYRGVKQDSVRLSSSVVGHSARSW